MLRLVTSQLPIMVPTPNALNSAFSVLKVNLVPDEKLPSSQNPPLPSSLLVKPTDQG